MEPIKVYTGLDDEGDDKEYKESKTVKVQQRTDNKVVIWIMIFIVGIFIGMYLKNMNDD